MGQLRLVKSQLWFLRAVVQIYQRSTVTGFSID